MGSLCWWCNNQLEKYEFVNGKDDIPYIMENTKMFETTNHIKKKKQIPAILMFTFSQTGPT
jgi:hypothetical protein